jgi:hypothetical protein
MISHDQLLTTFDGIVALHGVGVGAVLCRLLPLALAKGESKQQLEEVLDRLERDLPSTAFIAFDPSNKRYPVNVTETGRLSLASLSLVSSNRT